MFKMLFASAIALVVMVTTTIPAEAQNWGVKASAAAHANNTIPFGPQAGQPYTATPAVQSNCGGNINTWFGNCTTGAQDLSRTYVKADAVNAGNFGGVNGGSASAYADLATGKMGAVATAYGFSDNCCYGDPSTGTTAAFASMTDTLHFTGLAGFTGPKALILELSIDGSIAGNANLFYGLSMKGLNYDPNTFWPLNNPISINETWSHSGSGTATMATITPTGSTIGDWRILSPNSFVGTFYIDPEHPDVQLALALSSYGSFSPFSVDASHTATLHFILPEGVGYTSASGTFLTNETPTSSAVPEPATWATLLSGFGLIGGTLRTSRKTARKNHAAQN